jgi:hypothetical protein
MIFAKMTLAYWCQMAEFRAAGPKNLPNFNNNWQKLAQKFVTKIFYCTFSDDFGGGRLAAEFFLQRPNFFG